VEKTKSFPSIYSSFKSFQKMQNFKKILLFIAFLLPISSILTAQTAKEFYKKGIELYDNGNYEGALGQYEAALKIEPKNSTFHYEMASTYLALQKYDDAIKYAEKVIKLKDGNENLAHVLVGTGYDLLEKPKKAIKAYEEGIKAYPNDYNLYFNLGITLQSQKEYDKAESAAMSSIKNNPLHANSHALLANVEYEKNKKIRTMLPFYGYLWVKPTGTKALAIRELLERLYLKGVKVSQKEDGNSTISITLDMLSDKEEFSSEESAMTLTASLMSIKLDKKTEDSLKVNSTPEGKFYNNTETLFQLLSKKDRKTTDSFWQTTYVNPFKELYESNHLEAFCYSVYGDTEAVKKWQEKNVDKVAAYGIWLTLKKEKAAKR
jgi:Tfp pilus assembly protein PilF